MGVERDVEHVAASPEDLLGAVAVVEVHVEDGHRLAGPPGDVLGGDGGVVEIAEPAVHRARRVVSGRSADAVGGGLAAVEDEVDRSERRVHRSPRGEVGPRDDRRGCVERPVARPSVGPRRLVTEAFGHALHQAVGHDRLGRQVVVGVADGAGLGPGLLEELEQPRVVDRGDRRGPVLGGPRQREPPVGEQRGADPLGAGGDLVGRDALAEDGLHGDVVTEVERRVGDAHRGLRGLAGRCVDRTHRRGTCRCVLVPGLRRHRQAVMPSRVTPMARSFSRSALDARLERSAASIRSRWRRC